MTCVLNYKHTLGKQGAVNVHIQIGAIVYGHTSHFVRNIMKKGHEIPLDLSSILKKMT